MTARGIRILSSRPDSISHEKLSDDEILTSKRQDDALLFIYGCRWNVKNLMK